MQTDSRFGTLDFMRYLRVSVGFRPRTIFDIGANIGDFTKQLRRVWPQARVVLFEANQECAKFLAPLGEHHICLLGDENKEVDFYRVNNFECHGVGNSIFREQTRHFADENCTVVKLPMQRLDDVVDIPDVDFMKLDVQGSELLVLRGAPKHLARAPYVLLEVHQREYNKGAPLEPETVGFMEANGFELLERLDIHRCKGEDFQTDIMFRRIP